jgi:hypothetical protein
LGLFVQGAGNGDLLRAMHLRDPSLKGNVGVPLKEAFGFPGSLHNLHDPHRGHCQAGSLTGAVHLSKGNAGVLRLAQ